jgi:hypothetical protein
MGLLISLLILSVRAEDEEIVEEGGEGNDAEAAKEALSSSSSNMARRLWVGKGRWFEKRGGAGEKLASWGRGPYQYRIMSSATLPLRRCF